jgi:hypothetical protein
MFKAIYSIAIFSLLAMLVLTGCGQGSATPPPSSQNALNIATTSLPNGQTGLNYSQTLRVQGGTAPYQWSISEGTLPDGMLFSANNGIISGITQKAGTFNFSAQVKDSQGNVASQKLSITIKAAALPLTSGTGSLSDGEVSVTYSQPLKVYGGDGKYTWSITNGSLPDGLALSSNSGSIAGIPTAVGKSYFTVKVADGTGAVATEALTITVAQALSIDATSVGGGEVGVAYSQSPQANNGVPNYIWTVSKGALPSGLKIDPSNGNISGTPGSSGVYKLTLQLNDYAGGSALQDVSIQIFDPIALTTTSLPSGAVGAAYSQTLQYKGGNGTVVWAMAGGTLPDGLSFDGNEGVISGTPKSAGKFNISFQVIDSLGADSMKSLDLEIK